MFAAHPRLRARLPRYPLVASATPVDRLELAGVPGALWVKRDDRSCARYGGNKPRKLEFLLGAALARGSRRLVTVGGLGTNHGLATAILGGDAGLAVTLVLLDQPVTPQVREKLLLYPAYGAELLYGRNVAGTAVQVLRALLRSALRGEKPTLVPAGGSSPTGNVGFVCAGLELGAQIEEGALPEPAEIFVPVGSGGTLAGLVVGLRLAGLRSRARGVLVSDILPPSPRALQRAARRALRRLRVRDPALPELPLPVEDFALIRDQLGPGYGAVTPAAREAVGAAADAGLALETTYTGKCLAAIRALAARGALSPGPILFWNTFSSVDPRPGAPLPICRDRVPLAFRRFLGPEEGGEDVGSRRREPARLPAESLAEARLCAAESRRGIGARATAPRARTLHIETALRGAVENGEVRLD